MDAIQFCCEPPKRIRYCSEGRELRGAGFAIWFFEFECRCRREPLPSLRKRLLKKSVPVDCFTWVAESPAKWQWSFCSSEY